MILITTQNFPPDRGGIEGLMGGLAEALAAAGHDTLVLADAASSDQPLLNTRYRLRRIGGLRPWRRWRKAAVVRALVNSGGRSGADSETVHGIFADSWKSAEHIAGIGVPLAVLAHGMEFPSQPSARKAARIRRALASATTVIANSSYTARLVEPYVQGNTRVVVINPPISPQPEAQAQSVTRLQRLLGGAGPVLATLARLEPRKGVDRVIRALSDIRARYPEATYLVAGQGKDRARLQRLAEQLGVAPRVHFLGGIDDQQKAALFSLSDVFVMPARREGNSVEGFGIVYREAGWYGVPVLAGRDGGAVDAVAGETGLLCDGADPDDVTTQLLRMLDDGENRQKMGERASSLARGPAQWREAVAVFVDCLR
ncbi:glycosyltransferase family 4 protein [Microbulbifer bruguierae]|uniref:Glycosyltransferase family 4 protein n=1 Tax=Microbulbifer bruguierae TaxID=3029061 RepID=A0ABY8NB08_9GAMM|nr:glycosyltransferase family 4 protein [Microbulbifer bruguierae]WGL15988.1 glycosyltransferase family 4 protein [Microbulbifer bruguierae]